MTKDILAETIKVLLVEDDLDYAILVERWLQSADSKIKFVLTWTDSLSSASNRLAQGAIDVILLDLNLQDSEGVETVVTLTQHLRVQVPIIVLSSQHSESLALETVRHGAENYLVKSTCTADLLSRALSYAVARGRMGTGMSRQPGVPQGRVIALVGAKGGTGCTTVACTLASELHRQTNGSVLLADFDLGAGVVGFSMGLDSIYSLRDVIANLDRLDREIWKELITDMAGVDVLTSAGSGEMRSAEPVDLARIVNFVGGLYDWVVLDLVRVETYLALKDHVSNTLLITSTGITSIYRAKRTLDLIDNAGLEPGRISVVMNQRDEHAAALGTPDLKELFGSHACTCLPYDGGELREALMHKRLPAETSAFRSAVTEIARKLAGVEPIVPKRNLSNLFGLVLKSKAPLPNRDAHRV